jgi:hypothetical protein
MILGFTGSRRGMTQEQREHLLRSLKRSYAFEEIHHGVCVGADEELHRMLLTNPDITKMIVIHPPTDLRYSFWKPSLLNVVDGIKIVWMPQRPYIVRNHDIVDACHLLIACPNGFEVTRSGTWATVRYAVNQRKRVKIVYPDGLLEWR